MCRRHDFTFVHKVYYLKYKLSILFYDKILTVRPLRGKKSFSQFRFYFLIALNSNGFEPDRHAYVLRFSTSTLQRHRKKNKQATSSSVFLQNGSTRRSLAKKLLQGLGVASSATFLANQFNFYLSTYYLASQLFTLELQV